MTILPSLTPKHLKIGGWLVACAFAATVLSAQTPTPRIQAEISSSSATVLPGSQHPLAKAAYDSGRVPASTRMNGISLYFSRSAAQQADLEALIAAQQTPGTPQFHQWLTPDQFAARFGMAQSDLDKVQTWLQQQGFSIDSVARSRNVIRFSGTAGQVEQAFQTQMHYYSVAGAKHFAPSTALTVPTALVSVVSGVRNLDDFRPRPMIVTSQKGRALPSFTSSVSGSVFLTPGDVKVAYDMNPLIGAGTNGTGQTITVMGQSSIATSDIESFENAAGLTVKDPTQVMVPGSGSPQTFAGDEGESDLDLEWSGGIAPGAQIYFIYTGSDTTFGVFDSLQYAVDEKIGNILSLSYGICEAELQGSAALESVLQQAATQGQSVVAASGDSGSTACYEGVPTSGNGFPPLTTQEALAVSYPASSQYATGVGGTEITTADDVSTNTTYWEGQASTDEITSLKTYIPEVVWNDDTATIAAGSTSLSAGGGGVSTLYTTKPSWQTGVPGIPADGKRDVPDVSFYASPDLPGYLFCTSDTSDWVSGQAASCSNNTFRDASTQDLTIAGGTSFATPVFAGMVAILNQEKGYTAGQGLLNPTLYTLAANSTSYASGFHDVTTGNNACPSSLGANYCSGAAETDYSAGAGYDLATGLGSIDLANLAAATGWPAASTLIGTTTSVTAATTTPAASANDTVTITVASSTGTSTPTGNVTLSIDGGGTAYNSSGSTQTVTLASNGTATYTANFASAGVHSIVAQYGGDSTHAASTGSVSITIAGTSSGKGTIALAATGVTVAQGSTGTSTITVTPAGGYTGTVYLTFDTSNDNALTNLCYSFTNTLSNGDGSVSVAGTSAVTTQLTLDANAVDCVSGALAKSGKQPMHRFSPVKTSSNKNPNPAPLAVAFAGLLLAGFMGRSSRKLRSVASVIGLLAIGLALSACGGGVSNTVSNPPKGTYTITVTGQDSTTATITAQTTFTLTIN
ncbi:MAG TPA: protease pro-enzyme activation domain-containing protein [Terracidiphilus sp.]|jgi:subtilase family serine protease|nr:protease pro-enzyme activation domain-containing protein [Terracidiphilus sp.]